MIFGNASDFINHPIPKNSTGPPTTLGPQAPRHLNPALEKPIVSYYVVLFSWLNWAVNDSVQAADDEGGR